MSAFGQRGAAGQRAQHVFQRLVTLLQPAVGAALLGQGQLVLQGVDRAGNAPLQLLGAELQQEVARIEIVRQRQNPQIHLLGEKQFEHFVGPLAARLVAIEQQHNAIGQGRKGECAASPSAVPSTATTFLRPN